MRLKSLGPGAVVSLIAAAMIVSIGAWQLLRMRDAILGQAEMNIQNLCHSLAQHAGRSVEAVDMVLRETVERPETQSGGGPKDFLQRRAAALTQIRNLVVTDSQGTWIADTAPPHVAVSSADRAYFAWHRDHPEAVLHIDGPIVGRTSGTFGIPLSRRISRPDGSFGGVAVTTLAPEYFAAFYQKVRTGPKGTVALWMEDGNLLLRYPEIPDKALMDRSAAHRQAAATFLAGSGVQRSRSPWDGVERLFAFEHVDGLPLVVSAAVSIDDALSDWRRDALIESLVIGGAALALAGLGLGLEVHRRRIRLLEQASRKADEQYRLLADNAHDLIALKPQFSGARAYVSPSSRNLVGWEPEELATLPAENLVHPDDLHRVRADFEALTADHPVVTNEHRVRHKAGHFVWVDAVFRRMQDGSVLLSARNITERREAERALAESEGRFRSLAETSSDLIQLLDLSGHAVYVSPAAREMVAYDPADLIGSYIVHFIHPEEADRVGRLISDLAAGGAERARSVHRIRTQSGTWIWVDVQFRVLRDSGTGAPREIVASLRDVGEREALRQRLEDANRMLRLAESIAQLGHWRYDVASRTLTWSDEVYRIHGVDRSEFVPNVRTAIDFYHREDQAEVERCVSQALQQRKDYEFSARLLRPDGDVCHVLSRGLCELDASGTVIAIFGTIMDVTALRRAELAAVESEAHYRLLAENTTDMITRMDLTGRRLFVSPGSRDLLGYEPDELVSTNPLGMIHPDDAPELRRKFDALAAGRRVKAVNVNRLRHKEGHWVWVEASLRVLCDADGQPVGFVGSMRNVMDRKQAEDALRASEERYRALAETTSDVITQLDLTMRRRYVSPACRHVLGYEPDELLEQRPSEAIHPSDADEVRAAAARLVAGEITEGRFTATYRTRHKLGHWVWVEAGMTLIRDAATGDPTSLICSLRDVTERQRAARHLARAKAIAEQASRAKAEFLANMSHELRTPLTGILGVHDLLWQDPRLDDEHRRLINIAGEAGTSLLTIVNDVLDFSKIEAGHLKLESVPFDLDDLIAGCRDLAVKGLKGKPIEIRTTLHPALPRRLLGDPARLRQILLNLMTNAVKFTERGKITVSARSAPENGWVRVEVTDTGIGLPAGETAHLFDRFTQADASTTRRYGGTGLGLAICKRLTDLMRGRIGADLMPEGGSRFWFEVPLEPHDQLLDGPDRATRAPPTGSARLLLAEDHALNAEVIGAMLTSRGYYITTVPTGAAALEAVRNGPGFDLVLMDVQMPGMNGLDATRAIRALEAGRDGSRMPIVGLTANAMAEDAAGCLAAGMDAHVPKPIVWSTLFDTIETLLSRRRDLAPSGVRPAGPDAKVLDRDTFDELVALIGTQKLVPMLERFIEQLQAAIADFDRMDDDALAEHLHRCASMAGHFGLCHLSALSAEAEVGLRSGRPQADRDLIVEASREAVTALQREIETARQAIIAPIGS